MTDRYGKHITCDGNNRNRSNDGELHGWWLNLFGRTVCERVRVEMGWARWSLIYWSAREPINTRKSQIVSSNRRNVAPIGVRKSLA